MTLTLKSVLATYDRVLREVGPAPPQIRVTDAAVRMEIARVYPKRRAKSAAHLRRMNNKWKRRYGYVARPAAYLMDLDASGLGRGKIMFVHPTLLEAAERAFSQETPPKQGLAREPHLSGAVLLSACSPFIGNPS